jgi:hypothetical protein
MRGQLQGIGVCEVLESRRLLATEAPCVYMIDGVLHVDGTAAADHISVSQGHDWNVFGRDIPGDISVNVGDFRWSFSNVRELIIRGRGGDDRIDVARLSGAPFWVVVPTTIRGAGGNDTIVGGRGRNDIYGGAGDDEIYGGNGRGTIVGGDGNDWICGGDTAGLIAGGLGDDTIHAGSGNDTILGEGGNDVLTSGPGACFMRGGPGNDVLNGGQKRDTLRGGMGDDDVYVESPADVSGGAGHDRFFDKTNSPIPADFEEAPPPIQIEWKGTTVTAYAGEWFYSQELEVTQQGGWSNDLRAHERFYSDEGFRVLMYGTLRLDGREQTLVRFGPDASVPDLQNLVEGWEGRSLDPRLAPGQ